ncbi:hypothetical protein EZS27_027652 [termite gut metagenome]|uniref:Uncharacterized protein n=1 Tax=termite gut metagenome TaxID=433724 RepID=A0A5J4QP92_9ZZZZ
MQIKRYASHYLLLPEYGFLKQCAVEMKGREVLRIFLLPEEKENVEWYPGIILLSEKEEDRDGIILLFRVQYNLINEIPGAFQTNSCVERIAYLLYPFDFDRMTIIRTTRIRKLE